MFSKSARKSEFDWVSPNPCPTQYFKERSPPLSRSRPEMKGKWKRPMPPSQSPGGKRACRETLAVPTSSTPATSSKTKVPGSARGTRATLATPTTRGGGMHYSASFAGSVAALSGAGSSVARTVDRSNSYVPAVCGRVGLQFAEDDDKENGRIAVLATPDGRRADETRQAETATVNSASPRMGEESERVVLVLQEAVDAAKRMLLHRGADCQSYTTIEVDIQPQYYGDIMGAKGARVMDVSDQFGVHIKLPERRDNRALNGEQGAGAAPEGTNGEVAEELAPPKETISITGRLEDCEGAKQVLLDLVPVVEEMSVPFEFHSSIIGKQGASIRKLMDEFRVKINIPNPDQQSDTIEIRGLRRSVGEAKEGLAARVQELEKLALRNFSVEMRIDPKHHFKLIGARGVEVNKLRQAFEVEFQFPRAGAPAEEADKIVLTGLEAQVYAARDKIQSIIDELQLDNVVEKEDGTDGSMLEISVASAERVDAGLTRLSIFTQFPVIVRVSRERTAVTLHRYSAFVKLHDQLQQSHCASKVAALPGKNARETLRLKWALDLSDPRTVRFLEERPAGLESFLQSAAQEAELRADPAFRLFLGLDAAPEADELVEEGVVAAED